MTSQTRLTSIIRLTRKTSLHILTSINGMTRSASLTRMVSLARLNMRFSSRLYQSAILAEMSDLPFSPPILGPVGFNISPFPRRYRFSLLPFFTNFYHLAIVGCAIFTNA